MTLRSNKPLSFLYKTDAIEAVLELETKAVAIFSTDPNLHNLSDLLCTLRALIETKPRKSLDDPFRSKVRPLSSLLRGVMLIAKSGAVLAGTAIASRTVPASALYVDGGLACNF